MTTTLDFLARTFARPRDPGVKPEVSSARLILAECEASDPHEHGDMEIWERYGALRSAVQGLLELINEEHR